MENKKCKLRRIVAAIFDMLVVYFIAVGISILVSQLMMGMTINSIVVPEALTNWINSGSDPNQLQAILKLEEVQVYINNVTKILGITFITMLIVHILYFIVLVRCTKMQTLGRLLASVKLVNNDGEGSQITMGSLILKEIVANIILFLSVFLLGIPFIVNIILILVANRSLGDYMGDCKYVRR